MYRCRVEKDSISPAGVRLTSFVICFPRVVLAEVVTHRVSSDVWGEFETSWCERTTTKDVSKNSASSRAIPFDRMVKNVTEDPYMPKWTLNQKGMQGERATDPETIHHLNNEWLYARDDMIQRARRLATLGAHKQDCNRLLEPWMWVTQIVTSSRWDNFFALRCHKAAHPAFRHVARMMFVARRRSKPKELEYGQWHLPFVQDEEWNKWRPKVAELASSPSAEDYESLPDFVKFSAARCAWISYENHDKDGTPVAMLRTFDTLIAELPVHASPIEHQATPLARESWQTEKPWLRSNLNGWLQARKLVRHEEATDYNPDEQEIASWDVDEDDLWPA